MKILMLMWKSFGNEDIKIAFEQSGHQVIEFAYSDKGERTDDQLEQEITSTIRRSVPDFVFSFNYGSTCQGKAIHRDKERGYEWERPNEEQKLYEFYVDGDMKQCPI